MEIVEYLDSNGRSPFTRWFNDLDPQSAAKVTIALTRLGQGNLSNVKGISAGVFEYRIDFGPGYACISGVLTTCSFYLAAARRNASSRT